MNMLSGILHAGATKEQALDYVRELLDELDGESHTVMPGYPDHPLHKT